MGFIWIVVVGAVAGWLGGRMMTPSPYGGPGDAITGGVGAFVSTVLFRMFGPAGGLGMVWAVIIAVVGASTLLFASRHFMKPEVVPAPRPRRRF